MHTTLPTLGFLIHDVARLMKKRFEQNARGSGLTRSQWQVLVYLAQNEGICQRQLAELMELEPATLGRLVDRLVDSGLIERRADVSDRRVWQLHLTSAARSKLGAVRELGDRTRGEALSGLSEHDRRFLIKTLERLKQNLIGACTAGAAERKRGTDE